MENYTQLGIAGLTLAILFFIVRYFVAAMTQKDQVNAANTQKIFDLQQKTMEVQEKVAVALDANTKSSEKSAELSIQSSDKLSSLLLRVLKNPDSKDEGEVKK